LRNRLILVVVMMAVEQLTASRFVSDGDGIDVAAAPPSSPMPEKTTSPWRGTPQGLAVIRRLAGVGGA
jgi:hypothetical protein